MDAQKVGNFLQQKVSSERVGLEMTKLLESDHPFKAIEYLLDLGLGPFVFSTTPKPNEEKPKLEKPPKKTKTNAKSNKQPEKPTEADSELPGDENVTSENLKKATASYKSIYNTFEVGLLPKQERCILWLAVLLQKLRFLSHSSALSPVQSILTASLKMPNVIKDGAISLLNSMAIFDQLKDSGNSRLQLGLFVREVGPHWPLAIVLNAARLAADGKPITKAITVRDEINEAKLDKAYSIKPMLNGNMMMKILDKKSGGPWLAPLLKKSVEYQISNPECTLDDLKKYILSISD